MPATRKPSAQSTISFGGNHSKITKPGAASQDKNKTSKFPVIAKSTEDVVELPIVEEPGHVSSETAISKHAEVEIDTLKTKKTEDERRAEAITDMQIKKYWRAREAERIAPRGESLGIDVTSRKVLG
jgi:DNA polymerase delta subunit 4